uniref:NAD(P)(+)--arginine ADP-ribosyltransferase n=1 Tax=Sphaeramia orbicularis TaxID=375764 RepID=A0A673CD61_9TELE
LHFKNGKFIALLAVITLWVVITLLHMHRHDDISWINAKISYNKCKGRGLLCLEPLWHINGRFSFAWALAERKVKKPVRKPLKEDHAVVLHIYTREKLKHDFNRAVKKGKNLYNTAGFKFHYFYFYLIDAIQVLRQNQTKCRTTYYRTGRYFHHSVINTKMRFGSFIWATSSKNSPQFTGNISCFEIYTCFGADITNYSAIKQQGQTLIPPYEVFQITDILTKEKWCSNVYKLRMKKIRLHRENIYIYKTILSQ